MTILELRNSAPWDSDSDPSHRHLDSDSDSDSDSKPAGLGLGLESCPVRLGLGLDSRHAGLGLDSDSRKRGLVATLPPSIIKFSNMENINFILLTHPIQFTTHKILILLQMYELSYFQQNY